MTKQNMTAFTLIELLVVVTIIVVLLALLVPAMDQAIYQAELAVCGARLKGIATAVQVYAMDHKREYPYRAREMEFGNKQSSIYLGAAGGRDEGTKYDHRAILRPIMSINKQLNDPLCKAADFDGSRKETQVEIPRLLWYSWQFRLTDTPPDKPMRKLGDRFTWTQKSATGARVYFFDLLATDIDLMDEPTGFGYASHVDHDGMWKQQFAQDEAPGGLAPGNGVYQLTLTRWEGPPQRGLLDLNYAHDDGSVSRLTGMRDHTGRPGGQDDRVVGVHLNTAGDFFPEARVYIPKAN